jgi:serine/threonine-protein kinase RsbW
METWSGPKNLSVTLESTPESMDTGEEMARRIAGQAGFDEEEQYRISLAVRECLINAFLHGNKSDASKKIDLAIEYQESRLVFVVTDQGEGFALEGVPDPRQDERLLADSGRGIFLMRTFMDEVKVIRAENGGTQVTLIKNLSFANSTAGAKPEKES